MGRECWPHAISPLWVERYSPGSSRRVRRQRRRKRWPREWRNVRYGKTCHGLIMLASAVFFPWILGFLAHADRAESFLVVLAGLFGHHWF